MSTILQKPKKCIYPDSTFSFTLNLSIISKSRFLLVSESYIFMIKIVVDGSTLISSFVL